jgi:HprK-related kinase B
VSALTALVAPFETPRVLELRIADVPMRVLTNDLWIHAQLARYYAPYVALTPARAPRVVSLIQGRAPAQGEFRDLVRADGRRIKESVRDAGGGRLILKRASRVLMGLLPDRAFAVGDLRANLNQGINLVNAVYAKAILRRGYVLLHASAVSWQGGAVVLAGPPGAGKSTAALHCVEAGFRFLSNDRVLAKALPEGVEVLGYPKQPRVNPGTLLGHPRLSALLPAPVRAELEAMPADDLWHLERKSDVDLDALYGAGTVDLRARMRALVLLRWGRGGGPLRIRLLEVSEVLAALPLYYKDLGAFDLDREAGAGMAADAERRYRALLRRATLVEVGGDPDFPRLVKLVSDLLSR